MLHDACDSLLFLYMEVSGRSIIMIVLFCSVLELYLQELYSTSSIAEDQIFFGREICLLLLCDVAGDCIYEIKLFSQFW